MRKAINKAMTRPSHAHMNSDKRKFILCRHERYKYVYKWDLDDDRDGAHLTSFVMEFKTEEEAKENER